MPHFPPNMTHNIHSINSLGQFTQHNHPTYSSNLLTFTPTYIHTFIYLTHSKMTENTVDSPLRRIGQGFCGTVWAMPAGSGDTSAIKREDGGPGRSLHNDYEVHVRVVKYLSSSLPRLLVPACHEYGSCHNQKWWDERLSRFPKDFQVPCNALISERIPPFTKQVRDILIEKYCPDSLRPNIELIKSSEPNQDCLIRPYLGRRRRLEKQSRYKSFSLRNYPLHIDQIEELELDEKLYARIMAKTLAHLYWEANVDANDVEFVLAPPRKDHVNQLGVLLHHNSTIEGAVLGNHVVWILDFDCCRTMTLDAKGVEQAVAAFYRNDPYFPRPGRDNGADQILWKEFKEGFLEASSAILGSSGPEARLPALWVDSVEQRTNQNRGCIP